MKNNHFFALVLILGLFAFQNAYSARSLKCDQPYVFSEETCKIIYDSPLTDSYVLWRIYTQDEEETHINIYKGIKVKVDSVLRENFYTKAIWILTSSYKERIGERIIFYREKLNLIPNVYYLVLAHADCSQKKVTEEACILFLTEKNHLLPDTPENRAFLSEKRDKTKVVYEKRERDIDNSLGSSRSKAEIMEVVNTHRPELDKIYKEYLKLESGFNGKVTLKFTIAPSGNIISINIVSSTTGNPEFNEAIKNVVAKWKWGAIKSGNTTPTIPFKFTEEILSEP